MATSQNGWSVIESSDVAPLVVRGVAYAPGVRRSLIPLFADFCERLADIEPPHDGWCWGFAHRAIRGKTSGFSNHASGTAIDHNAPRHGRGGSRYAGFTSGQVKAIHALLERYDGVIRWGGDYQNPPYDAMHFEVVGSSADVNRVLKQLQKPAPTKEAGFMGVEFKDKDELETFIAKTVWGGHGERPSVQGGVNAADAVEAAVSAARAASDKAGQAVAAVNELTKRLDAFLLKQGGENPTGKIP